MTSNKQKNKKIRLFLIIFFLFVIFILVCIYDSNNKIQMTYLNFENNKISSQVKILHLSDLHRKLFGVDNKNFINKIKKESPDVIFITGDIAEFSDDEMKTLKQDSEELYQENLEYTVKILRDIVSVAPTYLILGNHEHVFEKFDQGFNNFKNIVANTGVILLINQVTKININQDIINILGVDNYSYQDISINNLIEQFQRESGIKIILDHYPTNFSLNGKFSYVNYDIDYVFSGHEHGGQIRIPFIGGIFSHEEGLFPKYCEGVYLENDSTLIISRGLGNSTIPVRVFNRPEIIVVTVGPKK
ncbi:MAG: metallophosphoesterase [Oscillospiraceae bacterium]|nr:metallophosphoesterase [Oscillospiraceae bacterium]